MSADFRGSTDQIPRGGFTAHSTEEVAQTKLTPEAAAEAAAVEKEIVPEENFRVRKGKGRFKARPTLTGAAQESAAAGEVVPWRSQGVKSGAQAMQDFILTPNPKTAEEFEKRLIALESEFPHGNIMDILMLVFMESIRDMNEDKKYFLKKLMMYNKMGEGLSKYLQDVLLPASDELGKKIASAKSDKAGKQKVWVEVREHETSSLGSDGEIVEQYIKPMEEKHSRREIETKWYNPTTWFGGTEEYKSQNADRVEGGKVYRQMNQMSLSNRIKGLESEQEIVRNKRQMASTAFQNFDQKTNQLYNLLSSVLKALGEMRMGTTRNML